MFWAKTLTWVPLGHTKDNCPQANDELPDHLGQLFDEDEDDTTQLHATGEQVDAASTDPSGNTDGTTTQYDQSQEERQPQNSKKKMSVKKPVRRQPPGQPKGTAATSGPLDVFIKAARADAEKARRKPPTVAHSPITPPEKTHKLSKKHKTAPATRDPIPEVEETSEEDSDKENG